MKITRAITKTIAWLLGLTVLVTLAASLYVHVVTALYRHSDAEEVSNRPVALVFGAGVGADGTLSPMLQDRVNAAVDLYKRGTVKKLLMTGDNSSVDYDEVSNMKRNAVAQGVPEGDIVLDYAGFNTYDSCYRAKAIFGVTQAVLVTQSYHLPRAIYTCRQLGVDSIGLGLPDWQKYPGRMVMYQLREFGSTIKALIELHITHPLPTFLGKSEPITF